MPLARLCGCDRITREMGPSCHVLRALRCLSPPLSITCGLSRTMGTIKQILFLLVSCVPRDSWGGGAVGFPLGSEMGHTPPHTPMTHGELGQETPGCPEALGLMETWQQSRVSTLVSHDKSPASGGDSHPRLGVGGWKGMLGSRVGAPQKACCV